MKSVRDRLSGLGGLERVWLVATAVICLAAFVLFFGRTGHL